MGFFRDLLGIVTEDDLPDMSEFAKYVLGLESVRILLQRDHGQYLPDTYALIIACLLTSACYRFDLKDIRGFDVDARNGFIRWILTKENGRVVLNDSDDRLIAWVLAMLHFDIRSRSAYGRLLQNFASVRANVRAWIMNGKMEENIDAAILDSYVSSGLGKRANVEFWVKQVNSQIKYVVHHDELDRCFSAV